MKLKHFGLLLLSFLLSAATLRAAHYTIDPDHSDVSFKVKHLMLSKVAGKFEKFTGDFNYDEKNPAIWSAQATIDAASINTSNAKRDEHLRGADFFDVAKYPTLSFKSNGVVTANGKHKLMGILNMHGVEKSVTLDLEVIGAGKDPWGGERAGFEATGTVNRKDFGIVWNKVMETGGLALGEDVEISIRIEGKVDAAPAPAKSETKTAPVKK